MVNVTEDFVPVGIQLPSELAKPAPRPLPDQFRLGPAVKGHNRWLRVLVVGGVLLIAFQFLPVIVSLKIYVLPLAFLWCAGLAMIAVGILLPWISPKLMTVKNLIRDGECGLAKVVQCKVEPTEHYDGQAVSKAIRVRLQMPHPKSGEVVEVDSQSESFPISRLVDANFKRDDFVPVIWDGERFPDSVQLYDFLGATPDSSLKIESSSKWPALAGIFLLFAALVGILHSALHYWPISVRTTDLVVMIVAGAVIGLVINYFVHRQIQRIKANSLSLNLKQVESGHAMAQEMPSFETGAKASLMQKIVSGLGLAAFCSLAVTCSAFFLNARLDRSEPALLPTSIEDFDTQIRQLVFRSYYIDFRMQDDPKTYRFLSEPEHMSRFKMPMGATKVKPGWFGWKWIESVDPLSKDLPPGFGMILFNPLDNPDDRKSLGMEPEPEKPGTDLED